MRLQRLIFFVADDFWGDQTTLFTLCLAWGCKMTVVNGKNCHEIRMRHSTPLPDCDLPLLFDGTNHYSAICKYHTPTHTHTHTHTHTLALIWFAHESTRSHTNPRAAARITRTTHESHARHTNPRVATRIHEQPHESHARYTNHSYDTNRLHESSFCNTNLRIYDTNQPQHCFFLLQ